MFANTTMISTTYYLRNARHKTMASMTTSAARAAACFAPSADDGSPCASPRGEDEGVFVLKKNCAFDKLEKDQETSGKKEGKASDDDDAVDSENVNELSDLFSTIESEFGETSAIDFSVLLEGEHAFNVEEVSEIFSDLEASATPCAPLVTEHDVHDATNVDEMAALFASLEEQVPDEAVDTDSDGDSTEEGVVTVVEELDVVDATNVDELSDLFTTLDEKDDQQAHQDWIAALDVDDVSELFSELEQVQHASEATPSATPAVDPRIFVPKFSIRMEGQAAVAVPKLQRRLPKSGALLAGPPGLLLAGPPVRRSVSGAVAGDDLRQAKRRAAADPSISETRRISAAKRRRVNGRFVREQNSFVSITALQPSSS